MERPVTGFSGKITTTGRSEAIRLDKALFKAHPEFRQRANVRAHVIGPGHLLVSVVEDVAGSGQEDVERDPVVSAFLAFLERDMAEHPERLETMSDADFARLRELTEGVEASDEDVVPDDVTL